MLVFLTGWDEIQRAAEALRGHPRLGNSAAAQIMPLHSMMATANQREIFNAPPQGVRKARLIATLDLKDRASVLALSSM